LEAGLDNAAYSSVQNRHGKQCFLGKSGHENTLRASAGHPTTCHPGPRAVRPNRGEAIMRPSTMIYLKTPVVGTKHTVLTGFMKRLGSSRLARAFFKTKSVLKNDPYLLILLANQEFDEGRKEQAIYLIEAAYEAFDQRKNIPLLRDLNHKLTNVPGNIAVGLSLT
jgi:hypothetical protein